MIGTASLLEIAWTVVVAVGLVVVLVNLHGAMTDRALLLASRESGSMRKRLIVARNVRRELVRVFLLSLFLIMGVNALLLPEGVTGSGVVRAIVIVGLMASAGLLTATSIMDARERARLE